MPSHDSPGPLFWYECDFCGGASPPRPDHGTALEAAIEKMWYIDNQSANAPAGSPTVCAWCQIKPQDTTQELPT